MTDAEKQLPHKEASVGHVTTVPAVPQWSQTLRPCASCHSSAFPTQFPLMLFTWPLRHLISKASCKRPSISQKNIWALSPVSQNCCWFLTQEGLAEVRVERWFGSFPQVQPVSNPSCTWVAVVKWEALLRQVARVTDRRREILEAL